MLLVGMLMRDANCAGIHVKVHFEVYTGGVNQ